MVCLYPRILIFNIKFCYIINLIYIYRLKRNALLKPLYINLIHHIEDIRHKEGECFEKILHTSFGGSQATPHLFSRAETKFAFANSVRKQAVKYAPGTLTPLSLHKFIQRHAAAGFFLTTARGL